jgi:hypothetical protein
MKLLELSEVLVCRSKGQKNSWHFWLERTGTLLYMDQRGKTSKQNSYHLKTHATQTAMSNSIQCQIKTLSQFICLALKWQ